MRKIINLLLIFSIFLIIPLSFSKIKAETIKCFYGFCASPGYKNNGVTFTYDSKTGKLLASVTEVSGKCKVYTDEVRAQDFIKDGKLVCPTINFMAGGGAGGTAYKLFSYDISDLEAKDFGYQVKGDTEYIKEKSEIPKEKEETNTDSNNSQLQPGGVVTGCEVIPEEIRKWINNILKFVRYVALALVIALGALDFLKAAGSGEPDAMKKSGQSFMKRMIAVVILFLLPVIVDFILNMVNIYGVDPNNIDCI